MQLFDVVVADSSLYMVFEYLNMDLKKLMDKKKEVFTPKLIKVNINNFKLKIAGIKFVIFYFSLIIKKHAYVLNNRLFKFSIF